MATPHRPTRSLKHEYELFVEQEIENYKESVPRSVLLCIGDDAVASLSSAPQFALTELLLCDEVDRIIFKRLRLPAYDKWRRRRLKLIGHAHGSDDPATIAALMTPGYGAEPERAFLIDVVGFDWNCPQHITPRFTQKEIERLTAPLVDELDRLRARIAELEG